MGSVAALLTAGTALQGSTFTFSPNDGQGDPDDMLDLDHYKYFTWGFKNFQIPEGEVICSAKLTIFDINNWTKDENGYIKKGVYHAENWLNIWLLDGVPPTITNKTKWISGKWVAGKWVPGHYETTTTVTENESNDGLLRAYDDADGSYDYFSTWDKSAKTKIATYTDMSGGDLGDVVTLNYSFADFGVLDELQSYIENGNNFAIGIDPDCHYWNTGVKLVIETCRVNVPDAGGSAVLLAGAMGLLVAARRRLRK